MKSAAYGEKNKSSNILYMAAISSNNVASCISESSEAKISVWHGEKRQSGVWQHHVASSMAERHGNARAWQHGEKKKSSVWRNKNRRKRAIISSKYQHGVGSMA